MSGPLGSSQWMYASGDYEIDQSLRFNSADSSNLSWTPSSAGNRKTWTLSFWYKGNGTQWSPFGGGGGSSDTRIIIDADGRLRSNINGVGNYNYSDGLYRDPSAWYHLVWKFDTTISSPASSRSILYINGEAISDQNSADFAENTDYAINTASLHTLSRLSNVDIYHHDGYMAEVHFIDGQALTPTSFGTTGGYGEWKPIKYTGSYGTNGFYLTFAGGGVMSATGGNSIATDGDYKVHSFTDDGTFTPTTIASSETPKSGEVEYLVIGGGGNGAGFGASSVSGGGGGAGGYRTGYLHVSEQAYSITVGAATEDSVFSSITSVGGGNGGQATPTSGGSGGGSGAASPSGAAGTAGQGNAGGTGAGTWGVTVTRSGGGGGSGGAGGNADGSSGGAAGAGTANSITGSSVTYAAGGEGVAHTRNTAGTPGAANTGNGGGGTGGSGGNSGGAGGTGIVIIRYKFQ